MKALIVANGNINDVNLIQEIKNSNLLDDDIVIACDGGLNHLFKADLTPDYILGDLDSASSDNIEFYKSKDIKSIKFNTQKDETDLEICIEFVMLLGVTEIIILGALGSRFDHSLTNVNLLVKPLEADINAYIISENNTISVINSRFNSDIFKKCSIGDTLSLVPLTTKVTGVTTTGLKYPLEDYTMSIGRSLGVSNEVIGENPSVTITKGYLIVVIAND